MGSSNMALDLSYNRFNCKIAASRNLNFYKIAQTIFESYLKSSACPIRT